MQINFFPFLNTFLGDRFCSIKFGNPCKEEEEERRRKEEDRMIKENEIRKRNEEIRKTAEEIKRKVRKQYLHFFMGCLG